MEITAFRRILHQHPEISGDEYETTIRVAAYVKKFDPDGIVFGIGGTGLLVHFVGKEPGNHVMIRSELDALPIVEINDFDHKSIHHGVSHKCGHDGHTAILCAVAKHFGEHRLTKGRVSLLFQPAEETGEGALAVLADERWNEHQPDFALSLHNLPGRKMHYVYCKQGTITPSVKSIIIDLYGKTAHAAEPECGTNPSLAVAAILQLAASLESRGYDDNLQLITPVHVLVGDEAYGISAGKGNLKFTLRAMSELRLQHLWTKFVEGVQAIVKETALEMEISEKQYFAANMNSPEIVNKLKELCGEINHPYVDTDQPFKWGEDFGHFTNRYSGAMFGLGAGEQTPALHNPDYDFPDELIETGATLFIGLIDKLL